MVVPGEWGTVEGRKESIMENGTKKHWTPKEKMEIVIEGMRSESGIADVCRKHGVSSALYYQWRDHLFKRADLVFGPKEKRNGKVERKIEKLEAALQRKDSIIAEITAENLDLKKTLSD